MNTIVDQSKSHCVKLLTIQNKLILPFHNLQHTLEVFRNVRNIGQHEAVSVEDLEILQIAALFHDTGMIDKFMGHEEVSASNANTFLRNISYSEDKIQKVITCIMATKMPQAPQSKLSSILCDADLFHLGCSGYLIKNELLRHEWQINLNIRYTDDEWQHLNLNFLKEHHYFTSYCQNVLDEKKHENWLLIEKQIN